MTDKELSDIYRANCECDGYPATNGLRAVAAAALREAADQLDMTEVYEIWFGDVTPDERISAKAAVHAFRGKLGQMAAEQEKGESDG